MKKPIHVVVITECRNEAAVVKVSMRIHKGHNSTLWGILLLCHGFVFWTSGPVWTRATVSVNPVDDPLWLITTVNDDGITTGSVRDDRASHLQRPDEKVVNPRFAQRHVLRRNDSFKRLSHPKCERPRNPWSTNHPRQPPEVQTDVGQLEV